MERHGGWTKPVPVEIERLMTRLGLRPRSPKRESLYRALLKFHADPGNQQRLDMKFTDDPAIVNEELHNFLLEIGDSYFGQVSREHLTSRAPTYDPEATTKEQAKTFGPLRSALLICCQGWRREQKRRPLNVGTRADQSLPTSKDSAASQQGHVRHSTRAPSLRDAITGSDRKTATLDRSFINPPSAEASKLKTYPSTFVIPSLPRSDSGEEVVPTVRESSPAPGATIPQSAEPQASPNSMHQETEVNAAAQKTSCRLRVTGNYAQALEARKALAVSRIGTAPSVRKSSFQEAFDEGKQTDEDDVARNGSMAEQAFARLQDFTRVQSFRTQSTTRLGTSSIAASTSATPEYSTVHRKRDVGEVRGSTTDALLVHEQDEPRPKRMRTHTSPANSEETVPSFDHPDRSPPQVESQPAPRPTPRTIRVQLCIQNHRGAFVEWPHGMMSAHSVQTLFEKFAECSRLRAEPDHINFFLADAKRKREFGIAKGDEEMFEDMKERIGIIVKEERHRSSFQVHMEAEVTVESDEEVVLEM